MQRSLASGAMSTANARTPAARVTSGERAILFALVTGYTLVYIQLYSYMSLSWAYLGATYDDPGIAIVGLLAITTGFMSISVPDWRAKLHQSFLYGTLFLILYIPCAITPYLQNYVGKDVALTSHIALSVGFLLMSFIGQINSSPFLWRARWSQDTAAVAVLAVAIIANVYIFVVFRNQLELVSFLNVYERRFASDSVAAGTVVIYVIGMLAGAVNPVLLSIGMNYKKPFYIAYGIVSYLLIYAAIAQKSYIISIFLAAGVFFLFSITKLRNLSMLLMPGFLLAVSLYFLLLTSGGQYTAGDASVQGQLVSIIAFRTLEMPGILYGCYLHFFEIYEKTFYTHIGVVGNIFGYPYGQFQLGQIVGQFISPDGSLESMNANANFLATDGVAAIGLTGVVLMCGLVGLLINLWSRAFGGLKIQFLAPAVFPMLMSLSNASLFTTILTSGGGLLFLILCFWSSSAPSQSKQTDLRY